MPKWRGDANGNVTLKIGVDMEPQVLYNRNQDLVCEQGEGNRSSRTVLR